MPTPRRSTVGGFTLIELMVVIAIAGLMAAATTQGFRSLRKADLREASTQLSGGMRYLFDRASTTGKIHRLVIDMEQGMYWAEVSDDKFFIPREAESEETLRTREDKEADEEEEEARKRQQAERAFQSGKSAPANSSFDLSKLEVGDFRPKRARFAAFKDLALKPVRLKKKVKVQSVYTPRVTEPLTSGRAYIYFFPLGQTEPAIVTMSNPEGDAVFSLVVHPITGRVRIYNKEVQPEGRGVRYDDEGKQVLQ